MNALDHRLPYRDFLSSYAPLHSYLDALFISLWHTPLAIILASVLVELLLLPMWLGLGRRLFDESTLRTAALLYVASPISLQFVTVDGQDNVLIALLLAGALLLMLRSRAFCSGVLFGLSAAAIKFLPLLFAPVFLVAAPRRARWALGAVSTLAVIYGGALLLRLPVLQPLTSEGVMQSAGNLPYLLESLDGLALGPRWIDSLLLIVLTSICGLSARRGLRSSPEAAMRLLLFAMCALTLALLLFSKKSWPPYLMLCLFPVCLLVASLARRSRWAIVAFACFGIVAVTEQSIWASLLLQAPSLTLHRALSTGSHTAQLFFGVHLLLIAGYGWLLCAALRRIWPPAKDHLV